MKKRPAKQEASRSQSGRENSDVSKNSSLDMEVHHLVELLTMHELSELEVEHQGLRIRVRRGGGLDTVTTVTAKPNRQPQAQRNEQETVVSETEAPDTLLAVTSPIVGTFYRSPSPDADPYIDEGDFVKKGQVLCIVEAMKLMNEIESEMDGRVHKILAESAKPVEYGQPLFLIDPTATP